MVTRLAVDDAARYLGISRPTVKRRLKNGSLRGVQERTPSGFKWYVIVDEPADGSESPPGVSRATPIESPFEATAESPAESAVIPRQSVQGTMQRAQEMATYSQLLLAPYVEKIEAQAERIGRLEERAEHLQVELAQARMQLAAATAPPSEAESDPSPTAPETAGDGSYRSWWRRAWAWVTGDPSPAGLAAGQSDRPTA